MPTTSHPLPRVLPGLPITARGWNELVGGVADLYESLAEIGRRHLEVTVTWRGRPVREARVFAVAVDGAGRATGPALEAAPPLAPLAAHQVAGVMAGRWRVRVEAAGFAPEVVDIDAVAGPGGGPLGSAAVELTRVTVPVPDLVGLGPQAARFLLDWATLAQGVVESFRGTAGTGGDDQSVLLQGPGSAGMDRRARVNLWYSLPSAGPPPWRAIVPDFLGWESTGVGGHLAYFNLALGTETVDRGATGALRCVQQSPAAGSIVAPATKVDVRYGRGDPAKAEFRAYSGTHTTLAGRKVKDVRDALTAAKLVYGRGGDRGAVLWAPWEVARTYLSDTDLAAVARFFEGFGAKVAPKPGEDLAAVWSSFILAVNVGEGF